MGRQNNQLPDRLPQLQNLIKRNASTYKEEFIQQYQHFQGTVEVYKLEASAPNQSLGDMSMFLAQVSQCYPEYMKDFPQTLVNLLQVHCVIMDPELRLSLCKALVLLRNKSLLAPGELLTLFFRLLRCRDKTLRQFLQTHIVSDIKNANAKRKDVNLNSTLQNFMYTMLQDSDPKAAKTSADIMIELYAKNVWNDAKTVNAIASVGCFSKFTKVVVASLKFFLGKDEEKEDTDSDSDDEPTALNVAKANKFNKKTRKREKTLEKVKKVTKKSKKRKSEAPSFNFSALQLVNDPQSFAERLFKRVESSNERFEVKLMTLDVVSRLVGLHDLFLFNFYPFLSRLIQPHQREVTKILQFAAQAAHELVPPDIIEPVLRSLVNNFITERNSTDVIAVGLNAVREICARCPLSMTEDLLRDLTQYKSYKDKSVMMAAKSLIAVYRTSLPELLHKRDRGRPTEAMTELKTKKYGEVDAKDYVPGSEVLTSEPSTPQISSKKKAKDDSDDDSWVDVNSDSEIEFTSDDDDDEVDENADEKNPSKTLRTAVKKRELKRKRKVLKVKKDTPAKDLPKVDDKVEVAQQISLCRIFTDEDFKRIDKENVKKQIRAARGIKRKIREMEDEDEEQKGNGNLVKLSDIENIHKKKKHDKNTRMEAVRAGRVGRDKFGYKDGRQNANCSKTNREKKKTKNYQMIIHKAKGKVKRSFKDKQRSLKNYLIKQKKMK